MQRTHVLKRVSLGLLLEQKGPAMNPTLSLLLVIFSALCIHADETVEDLRPRPDMLRIDARKTKRGWICGGVLCPKERTSACKTTSILHPVDELKHDLLVACFDADNKIFCGISRSSRIGQKEIIEIDDDGNMDYKYVNKIVTIEGKSIPRCREKGTQSNQNS